MSEKSCPICGDEPIVRGKHDLYCTPALLRLVRAAEKWDIWITPHASEALLCWEETELHRAVKAWRKERGLAPTKNWCGQCGHRLTVRACGPTHAAMLAAWRKEREK